MKKERVKNAINAAFRVVLITLGALLVINAIAAAGFSSINMGIIMPFVIGLPLLILGVFYRPITGLFMSFLARPMAFVTADIIAS